MARTRVTLRWRPNINFDSRRVAAAKEMARRVRASDVKIKFLLPRVKEVEVKVRENFVRKMKVRRVAKHCKKTKRQIRRLNRTLNNTVIVIIYRKMYCL